MQNVEEKIEDAENKIPKLSGSVTTAVLHTKMGKFEGEIPDISGLVKKTDYNAKLLVIEGKYFSTSDYN